MIRVVPTELTDYTEKPTGLSFSNPQNGLRFARQELTEMKVIYYKQSFLCRLSYDAQRLYALWIPKP